MIDKPIDISLPEELTLYLKHPSCIDLNLPKSGAASVQIPNGPKLKGVTDVTKNIPDDCSLSFSLIIQLAPLLANMDCLIKFLKLVTPFQEVMKPLLELKPPDPKVVITFGKALGDVAECVTNFFIGIPFFIRDILCLIIKILRCMIQQLKSLAALMGGIVIQIQTATVEGNTGLLASLECAQKNAATSASHTMAAIEPILGLLDLVKPLLEFAPIDPIVIPTFGTTEDVKQMTEQINKLEEFVEILNLAAEALGGCET